MGSGRRVEIRLEGVDRDRHGRIGVGAPQLPGGEAHRIEPLRVLTPPVRLAVGEDVAAVYERDGADVAAHVAGQAGGGDKMHVLSPHTITRGVPAPDTS